MKYQITAINKKTLKREVLSKSLDTIEKAIRFNSDVSINFPNYKDPEIEGIKSTKEKVEDFIQSQTDICEDDVLTALFDIVREKQKGFLESLIKETCIELMCEGYVIYKADTQKESMQLSEMIQTICPNLNDQQTKLFTL